VQGPLKDDGAAPEAEVLHALSNRDHKRALTLLMGLYGTAIYNYCRHLLGDAALADDVQQTTFEQVFFDLPSYRGQSSLRIWVYAIARHRCMDMLKMNRRREHHVESRETLPEVVAEELTAEERAVIASHTKHLARCLEQLPDKARDAILQRFMGQMSYEEMAELSGERAATLQMRVTRALPDLRRCLEQSGVAG